MVERFTIGYVTSIQKHFESNKANTSEYVWPDPEGSLSGYSLSPIHTCQLRFAPGKIKASAFDTKRYEAMAWRRIAGIKCLNLGSTASSRQ